MEGICTKCDIARQRNLFNEESLAFKHQATIEMHGERNPPGQLVSNEHPSCKDKRTHHAVY